MTKQLTANKTKKQLRELVATLTLEFVLGVILTTVVDFDPSKTSTVQTIILVSHILLGVYILVIAVLRLAKAYKLSALIVESWVGLISIIVALSSGGMAAQNGDSVATMIMAFSFVVALLAYGKSLQRLQTKG